MKNQALFAVLSAMMVMSLPMLTKAAETAAAPTPVCKSGKLPKKFQGAYLDRTTESGNRVQLTDSEYQFLSTGGVMKLKSCVIQGYRLISLTDPSNPGGDVQNGILLSNESGGLVVIGVDKTPTSTWPNRVSDLVKSPASAGVLVLEK